MLSIKQCKTCNAYNSLQIRKALSSLFMKTPDIIFIILKKHFKHSVVWNVGYWKKFEHKNASSLTAFKVFPTKSVAIFILLKTTAK